MKYPEGEVCHTVEEPLAFTLFLCYSRKADFPLKTGRNGKYMVCSRPSTLKTRLKEK